MNFKKLAIADVLKHPLYGIISYQPDVHGTVGDNIRVRTIKGRVVYVLASMCKLPTPKEINDYWYAQREKVK